MHKSQSILVLVIGLGLIYWLTSGRTTTLNTHTSVPSSIDLATEKQRCQSAALNWESKNLIHTSSGSEIATEYHFNPSLQTCLLETIYQTSPLTKNVYTVLDLYEDKIILSYTYFYKDEDGIKQGGYLYERGETINTSDPLGEYNKRRYALFEEPIPDYLK